MPHPCDRDDDLLDEHEDEFEEDDEFADEDEFEEDDEFLDDEDDFLDDDDDEDDFLDDDDDEFVPEIRPLPDPIFEFEEENEDFEDAGPWW